MSRNPDHVRIERVGKKFSVYSILSGVTEYIGSVGTVDKAFDTAYEFMDSLGHDLPIDRV